MTVVISDPQNSHGHAHVTHGHKSTTSAGHGGKGHTQGTQWCQYFF